MSLEIKIIPGELPRFWDRETIFFANLLSIFFGNEQQTKVLEREIRGAPTYGGRLISILNLLFRKGENLIFLECLPDKSLMDYMTNRLGLNLPEIEILSHKDYLSLKEQIANNDLKKIEPIMNRVRSHSAKWLDGYVTEETLLTIAKKTSKSVVSSIEGSKNGNNKFLLHHYLLDKGFPVFDTFEASSSADVISCLKKLKESGYKKAVLKSQIGASGCGMLIYNISKNSCKNVPDYLFFEGPCLAQGWLDNDVAGVNRLGSPSVQMFLSDRELSLYDLTEQLLSDLSVHEGNISPPPYILKRPDIKKELLSQAAEAGRWLHSQGYRGTAGVDFLVVEKDNKLQVIINEINARITGATYPAVLARYFLPHGAWIMRNLSFHCPMTGSKLISELDRKGLLFEKNIKKGVLPFNFNQDKYGNIYKGQFLFLAPEPVECECLLTQLQKVFPLFTKFDRD